MYEYSEENSKSSLSVHIVLSDEGWILERLAREIADRLPYVSYSLVPDPSAAIQYYVTYGCRKTRVSPIEMALFTHREEDAEAGARFDAAARDVDHAVSMSSGTAKLVKALGVTQHSCIMPGVDLDIFHPKLKVAVVGRTYHTGRKGEALVSAVMDVPDIEWHFTGPGWPGPAINVTDEDLPSFYRSMDYILVPALNEGGPMSVLEALASGVQVIASTVGWVPDFPHIPFAQGDAASLRKVLMDLRAERMKLRASVVHMTWDNWAAQHDDLFRKLMETLDGATARPIASKRRVGRVALVTHGIEDTTLGGPSVRVPNTAQALRTLNVNASVIYNRAPEMISADLVHGFNIWLPKTAVTVARGAKRLSKPLIFSPIMLDLSEGALWQVDVFRTFRRARTTEEADGLMRLYAEVQRERKALDLLIEPEPGYRDTVREIAGLSDGLIFLSETERRVFQSTVGETDTPDYLVRNPVDAAYFAGGDPDLFRNAYGLRDYVLCIGRIEPRKNQLMLVSALRETGLPVVLVGHSAHPEYAELVKRFGGPDLLVIDRIDPRSEQLRSAIAGARVFALPSWAEGAPLAALEAAAAGANMVLSNRSGEHEYFGKQARYCDPGDMTSIRDAVLEAWDTPLDASQAQMLTERVAQEYSWDRYARETLDVYEDVMGRQRPTLLAQGHNPAPVATRQPVDVIFDVTTWANNSTLLSGIVRVERSIALELLASADLQPRFVVYLSSSIGFVELPREVIAYDLLSVYVGQLKARDIHERSTLHLPPGGDLIAVGSSWMQNTEYWLELSQLAQDNALTLSVLMHDMTPTLFPHWYLAGYSATWEKNCAGMIAIADRLLVYSESTRKDVTAFALARDIVLPAIGKIRLADEIGKLDMAATSEGDQVRQSFRNRPFILSVGGIHLRKNYALLYDVWQILREEMGHACPHLLIVGGVSWNGGELARVIRGDPKVNEHIHILENIDDGTLAWLYENALATAYPSLYEGWGLPVGESLAYGKICLSSNTSSMKEIAPEITDLIDPFDRRRWAAMIRHYASSASARAQREQMIRDRFACTTWQETTQQIVDALSQPTAKQSVRAYNLGEIVIVTKDGDASQYMGSGWYQREGWGCWARQINPSLKVRLVHPPEEDLVLSVLAKVLKSPEGSRRYDVRVNGTVVATWCFPPDAPTGVTQDVLLQRAVIPAALARLAADMTIEFVGDRLTPVSEVSPGTLDRRSMGFGLVTFLIQAGSRMGDTAVLLSTQQSVRDALRIGPTADLPSLLTKAIRRPSPMMDDWIRELAPFLRSGVSRGAVGTASENGTVVLGLGLARVRYDRDLTISSIVDAPAAESGHPITIGVFVNNRWLHSIILESHAPTRFDIVVPLALMTESDPLNLSLFGSGKPGRAPTFIVHALHLSQGMILPSERRVVLPADRALAIGTAPGRMKPPIHMLQGGWYSVETDCVWSTGQQGRLRFSVAPPGRTSLAIELEIDRIASGRNDDVIDIVTVTGTTVASIAFPPDRSGARKVIVPIGLSDDGSSDVELRLVPNNPTWPEDVSSAADTRRLGVRLLSMNPIEFLSDRTISELALTTQDDMRVRLLEGWHNIEPAGAWSNAPLAKLAFHVTEDEQTCVIVGGLRLDLAGGEPVEITIALDNEPNRTVWVDPRDSTDYFVPLPHLAVGVHIITIGGVAPRSMNELGLGDDARPLGIWLSAIRREPKPPVPKRRSRSSKKKV